ncbi:MAG: FHA domain-containing protein [Solirubrobacteraceae bacterium]
MLDPAPLRTTVHSAATDAADETHAIPAPRPFVVDSYALLDHRTRERLIDADTAPAGRYLALEHAGHTRLIPLARPITHIGRGLVADVRLQDPHVSRRHAIVALRGDGARALDDRSANGTYVNGRRVTTVALSDGDVLRIGRAVLRYVEVAPRRRPEPVRRTPLAPRAGRTPGPAAA